MPEGFDSTAWDALLRGWKRSLGTKGERTQALYLRAGEQLLDYVEQHDGPGRVADPTRASGSPSLAGPPRTPHLAGSEPLARAGVAHPPESDRCRLGHMAP